MWRTLTQLPSLLAEIILLLREQNSLTREIIHWQTGRPAQTPLSPGGTLPSPLARPRPDRKRQATDVTVYTREDRIRQQQRAQDRENRPWATEDLGPPEPRESGDEADPPGPPTPGPE